MQSVRQGILQTRQLSSVSRCAHQSELSPLTGGKDIADPIAGVFEVEFDSNLIEVGLYHNPVHGVHFQLCYKSICLLCTNSMCSCGTYKVRNDAFKYSKTWIAQIIELSGVCLIPLFNFYWSDLREQ